MEGRGDGGRWRRESDAAGRTTAQPEIARTHACGRLRYGGPPATRVPLAVANAERARHTSREHPCSHAPAAPRHVSHHAPRSASGARTWGGDGADRRDIIHRCMARARSTQGSGLSTQHSGLSPPPSAPRLHTQHPHRHHRRRRAPCPRNIRRRSRAQTILAPLPVCCCSDLETPRPWPRK